MIYIVAALFCFIFSALVKISLDSEDWTRNVKISYGIVLGCGFIFTIASVLYFIFH